MDKFGDKQVGRRVGVGAVIKWSCVFGCLFCSQCLKRLPTDPKKNNGLFLGFFYPYSPKNPYFPVFFKCVILQLSSRGTERTSRGNSVDNRGNPNK